MWLRIIYTVYKPLLEGNSDIGTFHSRRSAWCITSASTLGGCCQLKLVQTSSDQLLVCMTKRNSVACNITSNSDFDQGGCIMQIEWTKALCNNCQHNALNYCLWKSDRCIRYLGIRLLCLGLE